MGRVIAVVNQKGGVGKTTTAVNLASAVALRNRRVLVIDIDSQGNATSGLGVDKHGLEATLYEVFLGIFKLSSVIVGSSQPSLWVAPSNSDLVGVELELHTRVSRETLLKEQLESLRKQFDLIVIDCPPSLSLLTLNALVAADSVLVPLQCEYYALEGLSALMETLSLIRTKLNKALELDGVVLTLYDARTNLCRQIEAEARQVLGDKVFTTVIPRNIRLSESPSHGKPIFMYDPDSPGAKAYLGLAKELLERIGRASATKKGGNRKPEAEPAGELEHGSNSGGAGESLQRVVGE